MPILYCELSTQFAGFDNEKFSISMLFIMYCGSHSLASYRLGRLENPLLADLQTKGSRLGTGLPHCHRLFVGIGASLGITKVAGDLAVLGQVEGGDLLGLLDLLLVGLHLALKLVDEGLHPLVVLAVLIGGKGELLDGPLELAKVLGYISVAPVLSVKLGLKLADAGLHLDHGLPASLQGVDLGLIGTGGGVLALGLQQLLVLLQVHGKLLLATKLISKTSSVNHGAGSLVLREPRLVGHLVQVSVQLAKLALELPLGGGDGLVDVGEVSQGLVGVSELLLSSTALAVGSLKKSTSLLKTVGNGSGPAVSSDLGVGSGGLGGGLLVNLDLSVAHLEGVLLDGGLGLSVASNGMLKSQAKVSSVSLELLLHPESLSLALGLGLKGHLHGVKSLGLGLLDEDELLLLLGKAALDLLPDGVELQLAPQHLVLLLLKGGLGLLQGGLQLHLLGLKAFPDFVNLVDGASTLADLVHDVLDLVGESLVLPADLLQLEHGLFVGRLHLDELRGGVAGLLLADIQVEGKAVNLALPLADHLVELLGLPVHGGVEDLGLVEAAGHLSDLGGNLALGLLNLVQLGVKVVDGGLSLGQTSGELHLGHLELLALGNSVGLVLLTPALGLGLSLGNKPQGVLAARGLLLKGAPGSVKLVLEVPVLAQKKSPLASLVVAQGLDVVELGGKGSLLLGKDVQVVVKVSNNAEEIGVLTSNLVLGGGKVSQGKVGIVDLLVDGVQSLQHLLVGHVGGGLGPHHLISGSAGISDLIHDEHLVLLNLGLHLAQGVDLLSHLSSGVSLLPLQVGEDGLLLDVGLLNVLAQLVHFRLPLLVELHLGGGGTAGLVKTLTKLVNLPGKVGPLPLCLGTSLALGLQLLLHGLNTALDLLDSLLGLGNQVLLIVELGSKLVVVLLLVGDGDLNVTLGPLQLNNAILSHLQVALKLPLLLLDGCPGLLLLVQAALQLTESGLKLGLDGSQVSDLLVDRDHVIVGLGLCLGNVLLLLVQLVDDLVLLADLILEHLDGVVTVALLQLDLGNGKLDVLDLLLHHSDGSRVGLDLSSKGNPGVLLGGEDSLSFLQFTFGLDLGGGGLGLPVGVDGDVALLLSQLLAHGFDLSLEAVHAALKVGGDIEGLLVLSPGGVGLLLQKPELLLGVGQADQAPGLLDEDEPAPVPAGQVLAEVPLADLDQLPLVELLLVDAAANPLEHLTLDHA